MCMLELMQIEWKDRNLLWLDTLQDDPKCVPTDMHDPN